MHAFILAGGFATRLWPLTESRPKPLLPVAGKPILTHLVEKIPKNISITVSTNAVFANAFHEWRAQPATCNLQLSVLIEDTRADDQKHGDLGAVAQWITDAKIDDDVLLLTGDNYIGFSLSSFIDSYNGTTLLAAHDVAELERAKQFGTVILDIDGKSVSAFEEKPNDPKSTLVSTGCSILPRSTLPILKEYAKRCPDNVGGIFEELLQKNIRVEAFIFHEPWFDIGSFDAYLAATKVIVGNNVITGEGSQMEGGSMKGSVVMGKNCTVRNATLENVVLFDNCTIENCELSDCICDDHCIIKGIDLRGKMLRKNTKLVQKS
jgi:glucose-1-phosphate thymidylyltransferase